MIIRALIFLSIIGSLNIYVAFRFIGRWPWQNMSPALYWTGTALFFLLQFAWIVTNRVLPAAWREQPVINTVFKTIDWVSFTAFGIFSCFFIYTICAEIVGIISALIWSTMDSVSFDRRRFLALGAATLASTAMGIGQATSKPHIEQVDVHLDNLPEAFDGFRIAQISDLHLGSLIGHDYAAEVVQMTNELNADLIALTGDFVDGSVEVLQNAVIPLANLKAPEGVFFITGNHEYYSGPEAWIKHFKTLGFHVLENEHIILKRDNASLVLAGVNDYSTLHNPESPNPFNPQKALAGAPLDTTKILLAHQPASYDAASKAGFDLQLSGHTHAGQYFPFNLFIGLFQRYYRGLNRHDNMWIYVNRGTGYWGPPLRTGVPSEITLLTLRRATVES